jgi:sugar phosphate permease
VRRLPIAKLLGVGMLIWSALLMGLGFSLSIPPVFAIRFLLGLFESLVGPCLLALTVQWYLKEEQPFVSATWQCMLGLNGAIGGLLGFGFYHVEKAVGLHGWQWMTIACSIFSFISSVIVLIWLPDSPTQARWASDDEKVRFVERVRSNNQGLKNTHFKKEQVLEAFTDPYTLLLFLLAFFQTLVVGGINTFNALLLNKAFGFSVLDSQLLSIPLGAMTIVTYMLISYLITKTNQTLLTMIGFTVPNIVGSIVLLTVAPADRTRGGLVVAFYCMQVFQAVNPAIFLMLSRNSAGQTKKSVTYAVTYIGWAGGNACAPQLFQARWAPRYITSLYIHLALYACFILVVLATRWLLVRRNKAKIAAQGEDKPDNSLAFEDLTDLQNPDFRYSI